MTTADWSAVLAATQDPQEVRDTLLVLADDLPDEQGEVVRELATSGRRPYLWDHSFDVGVPDYRGMWATTDWWLHRAAGLGMDVSKYECCVLPDPLAACMTGTYLDAEVRGNFCNYRGYARTWLALLEALPLYVADKVHV